MVYNEKKGEGKTATFKGNNGDIVGWNADGNIVNVEDHVIKVSKERAPKAKRLLSSNLDMGASVFNTGGKNRRDFSGSVNIIGWC